MLTPPRNLKPRDVFFVGIQKALIAFGRSGEYVWQNGAAIQDPVERLDYLKESLDWLRAKTTEAERPKYLTAPVDFRTFIECERLLNKRTILWPEVIRCGAEMNSGRYQEVVLTGGIGVAKTTLAVYSMAYQLYLLSCMNRPHTLFDLDPSSEIMMVFQSLNKNLAMDVDYRRFRDMIDVAPYFNKVYPFDRNRLAEMRFPNNIVVKPVSGSDTGAIGQNVIGGIIDEVNFMALVADSKMKRDGSVYDQAAENYNSIARRRESRFMQMGALPGLLCLVSSKNYPGGLTDRKQAEARTNKSIYVYDKRLWEIRPERFGMDRFRVFCGDETRHPRILSETDIVAVEDEPLTIAVPIEYRRQFELDLLKAIRDIAGYSTQALHPFMLNTEAVGKCFGQVPSILTRESCDFKTIFVQVYYQLIQNPTEPRFAHIDLALSKDSAGLAIGHVPGFKHMNRGDYQETLPIIQFDCILEVMPPVGGEIVYDDLRKVIYSLRDKYGLPIRWVSFDQFQSTDSQQILSQNGFVTGYQSMDTDTHAYDATKQAFYDGRIIAPAHAKAQKEMCTLEFDVKKLKIDHPPQGSKDVSDAMAGVVWGLSMQRPIWLRHGVSLNRMPASLAAIASKSSVAAKEQQKEQSYMNLVRAARGVMALEADHAHAV
jgi:hypothetical protein